MCQQRAALQKHLGSVFRAPLLDLIRSYGEPVPADDLDLFAHAYEHWAPGRAGGMPPAPYPDLPTLAERLLGPLVGRESYKARLCALLDRIGPTKLPLVIPYHVIYQAFVPYPLPDDWTTACTLHLRDHYLAIIWLDPSYRPADS